VNRLILEFLNLEFLEMVVMGGNCERWNSFILNNLALPGEPLPRLPPGGTSLKNPLFLFFNFFFREKNIEKERVWKEERRTREGERKKGREEDYRR